MLHGMLVLKFLNTRRLKPKFQEKRSVICVLNTNLEFGSSLKSGKVFWSGKIYRLRHT